MRYQVPLVLAVVTASTMLASVPASADLPDFKAIIRQNQASVVNISTTQQVATKNPMHGVPPGLEEFFRPFRGLPGPRELAPFRARLIRWALVSSSRPTGRS
jgi:hypothetical protein